ncbi:MAG: UDP-glucose 4-epimerase GalE [Burkholderiales bacterium]
MAQTILVTGGTGYIGSHTVVELLNNGYDVIVVDNLSNSNIKVLNRISNLVGYKPIKFYRLDITDKNALNQVFKENKIDAVIHFAALKAVGESVAKPLTYYQNNVGGSLTLFEVMQQHQVTKIVFSSSATVYGNCTQIPIKEEAPLSASNPYGWSKLMVEQILNDIHQADNSWGIMRLRYFNPVGAHSSGAIGEDPNGIPNNLMPYISQVAIGKQAYLNVFGSDYPTHDGTGVRDYIHVVDLALGHVKALTYLDQHPRGLVTVNLGTGVGYSVLDIIAAFEKASEKKIAYKFVARRSGDVAKCYADPTLAYELLGFKTKFDIIDMCKDSWNWQSRNPNGYG